MADEPLVVVGINRTQDGSIAVACGDDQMYSLQKERLTRRKHHWGRLGDVPRFYAAMPQLRQPVDLVVESYSSDNEIANLGAYHRELTETLTLKPGAGIVRVSHHLTHIYSAFFPSPFHSAAGMIVDAQGSPARDFTESAPAGGATSGDLLEISSFYRCRRDGIQCVAKQLWNGDWAAPAGLGCFYSLLTKTLWPQGEGNEGKVMGLAPFDSPDTFDLPELQVRDHEVHIPPQWLELFAQKERFRHFSGGDGTFQECADLAAAGQHAFEEALLKLARWLHSATGEEDLVFAGGTALNCSANGRLLRSSPFRDLFIPPSPHDGGTAVGSALYGLVSCLGRTSGFRWTNDFLGPETLERDVEAAVRDLPEGMTCERPADLVARMVDLLETGRVVAVHHGRSESGPRALGNRSILADPRLPDMQDYINFEVKGREWFRPLAPLVLAEYAEKLFDVDRPAPFMQYAADVRPEYRSWLPAIVHVDGSARLQTVEPVNTPLLYALLQAWYERTGCPVLLNTSLNGPGDPLTETPQDSLRTLRTTNLHALAMPPYLVSKTEEPTVPGSTWHSPRRQP